MLQYLKKGVGAAGVAYMLVNSVYGNTEFVHLGYGIVPAWQVIWGASGSASILYLASEPIAKLYRKVFPKPEPETAPQVITKFLKAVAEDAADHEDDELFDACEVILRALEDVKS